MSKSHRNRKENYKIIPFNSDYFKLLKSKNIKNKLLLEGKIVNIKNVRQSPNNQTYFETNDGRILHASFFKKLNNDYIKKLTRINKIKIIKQYE